MSNNTPTPAPKEHDATLDQAGLWPLALAWLRSYRAQPVEPDVAPPGWMTEAGSYSQLGHIVPVGGALLNQQRLANQLNLPPIGPTDESVTRAHALSAALSAFSNSNNNTAKRGS